MENSLTIKKVDRKTESPLNYHYLRELGLKHIEQLSGRLWTDYNTHDPGITILEALSFALTDLAYRVNFPLEDILADKTDNEAAMYSQFYTALQLLPSRPVTITDYRKLLVDIPGIKNAWLKPVEAEVQIYLNKTTSALTYTPPSNDPYEKVEVRGIYEVLIEFEENLPVEMQDKVKETAMKRLHFNRNLCEDFKSIGTVPVQDFILCAELELSPEANVEKTEALVLHTVQEYLTPGVGSYTLKQMLEKGKKVEEIYEGPLYVTNDVLFQRGFIDTAEIENSSLKEEIRLSDIIRLVMDIKGVVAVKDILIKPNVESLPEDWNKWNVKVKKGHQPKLNTGSCRIVHYKDILPFRANQAIMLEELKKLREEEEALESKARVEDLPMVYGEFMDPGEYHSITADFPFNYGIGEFGLPENAGKERLARARQLKGYLLLYDQLLANYFAQLAHIKELFSSDETIRQTYFSQTVKGLKNSGELYFSPGTLEEDLEDLLESQDVFFGRRNRFLDHLLARFNERFNEYALLMYSLSQEEETRDDLIYDKALFIQDFPEISMNRFAGFDYTNKNGLWDTFNVSGLQHRVARLMGISNYSRRNLSKITYDIYEEKDQDEITEYRFRVLDKAAGKILISSSTRYTDKDKAIAEMRQSVNLGFEYDSYQKKTTKDGRYYFNLIDGKGEVAARRIEYFETEDERDEAIRYLRRFLLEKYSGEGMFVIEHLLLRPREKGEAFMPVCVDSDKKDCPDTDPYSFRISVILPAWEKRFADMHFRRFFEKTLRMETPAHILPRICWINEEDMSELEDKYRVWLIAHQKYPKNIQAYKKALKEFIEVLSRVKSVYPEGTLHDCIEGADENPIILGSTNIGKSGVNKKPGNENNPS